MHGFICIISKQHTAVNTSIRWKKLFSFQNRHIQRSIISTNYQIEQYTSEKFLSEKIWIDNDDFLCVTEGIILNINILHKKHNTQNATQLFSKLSEKDDFVKELQGTFTGIFYDKKKGKWYAFNNQMATKRLFYFQNKDYFILSTDLYTLSESLKNLKITRKLNTEAAYLLLSAGFMMDNHTLIADVWQVGAGEYLEYDYKKINLKNYFHLEKVQPSNPTPDEAMAELDRIFKEALLLELEIDKKYQLTPVTTLSGGLDSRMVALLAEKAGCKNQFLLNFSEKGYADDVISRKIARKYRIPLQQIHLLPESLANIDDVIAVNDGLTIYTGCSHVFSTLEHIDVKNYGATHSGILGDAVLGSYVSVKNEVKPDWNDGFFSKKIKSENSKEAVSKIMAKFPNKELYKFYNRGFMAINNGFLYFDLVGECFSPFLHPDFISYAYSLPQKYKYKENLYIQWIRKYYPDAADFTWESIGGKPTNNRFLRFFYRYKRAIIKRLPIKTMWKNTMTPEQKWYDNNENVKKTLDDYFYANTFRLNEYPNLKTEVENLYTQGDITIKAQCITLVGAAKLLFND